jgi:hypothetical protein
VFTCVHSALQPFKLHKSQPPAASNNYHLTLKTMLLFAGTVTGTPIDATSAVGMLVSYAFLNHAFVREMPTAGLCPTAKVVFELPLFVKLSSKV